MTRGDIPGFGRTFGHSKLTLPNLAAVPAALGNVSFGPEYLILPGQSRFSATLALARDGPDVRDCRILLRCRIERRVGLVDATHGDLCDTRGELTTPIIVVDNGKLTIRRPMLGFDIGHHRRVPAALATA